MSKAFLRESDDAGDDPVLTRATALPLGARNFLTEEGAARLRLQLEELRASRQPLTSDADTETRRNLQVLDDQIRRLDQSLRSAEIASPPEPPWDIVRFGATVTVRDGKGVLTRYRLVGVDEADAEKNWVSWQSPIARVLLNAHRDETVTFTFPAGKTQLTVVDITYDTPTTQSAKFR